MNYKQSKEILKEIKKAKKILLNCHRGPDPDSAGSALAMYAYLKSIGKDVRVLCPDNLPPSLKFLPTSDVVEKVEYDKFDFSKVDLFISLDSGDWKMVSRVQEHPPEGLKVVVIDHHKTNPKYGMINIVDREVSSCAEIVFSVLIDFGASITKDISTCLFTGIAGDTGVFQYPGVTSHTFEVAQELMKNGADKDDIIFNIYRSVDFMTMKFLGLVLKNLEIDIEHKFVWSAVNIEEYLPYRDMPNAKDAKSQAASMFMQCVEGTDFGFMALENDKNNLRISFRSRTGIDVSKIAEELGGGGHKAAAGGEVTGLTFDKAVEKVLEVAMKHARKAQK